MKLTVFQPAAVFLDETVAKVVAQGPEGAFGILPRHLDMTAALPPGILPLLQAASRGVPDDREIRIMLLDAVDDQDGIQVRVGIFFNEILAGCSCGDQPMSLQSYCELQVDIDKRTAEARFSLLDDEPS